MRIERVRKAIWGLNVLIIAAVLLCGFFFFTTATKGQTYDQPGKWDKGKRGAGRGEKAFDLRKPDPWSNYGRLQIFPKDGLRPPEPDPVDPTLKPEDKRGVELLATLVSYWRYNPSTDESRVTLHRIGQPEGTNFELNIGQKIPDSVWMLVDVEEGRAIFKNCDDPEADEGVLELKVFEAKGPGGAIVGVLDPDDQAEPGGAVAPDKPDAGLEAIEISPGKWEIGKREVEYLSDEQRIQEIKRSITAQPWKNPETGKREGLKIRKIASNSYVAKRGVKKGDVLISINGVPVTNREDVVNYIRGTGKGKKQYIVKLLRNGQPVELVYSPKK